ncbi:DedA family protein [Leptospira ognonensis]|uniref:DedA family protein n=2 Tax=Leptospira ognonensis TaxID=2484945 RepID=A0A4R9K827_9LEPT|nr:DedA family protein [Leptospira ognonensis]
MEFLTSLPGIYLLCFFGFSNFLENVFPPWPGDTFTVFSGFLASSPQTDIALWQLILATLVGNWAGALLMFYFGKKVIHFLRHSQSTWIRNHYQEESFEKTIGGFRKYSGLLIIVSRFSAGIRFFVAIVAGISKMNPFSFLFYYSIAITIWCGLLISAGFKLGKNWEQINVMLAAYNQIITIFLCLVAVCLGIYYFYRKREQS